jgi:hypothetical protein
MRWRGIASVALIVLWAAAPQAARAADSGDTGVVNVSNTPGESEGEEPLSVNPLNPDQLVTVANVFQPNVPAPVGMFVGGGGVQDTKVYSSRDGGRHWLAQKLDQGGIGRVQIEPAAQLGFAPEFSDAFNILNTDADSAWDRDGNAFFESGDVHGVYHGGDEQETVWRSGDGGVTWGPPRGYTAVSAAQEHEELDRPWLAMDASGGPRDGTLYTTFETSAFVDDPPKVFVKHSTDGGATWSPTQRVDDGTYETQFNARNRPVVGADGTLYVVYDRAPVTVGPPKIPQTAPIQVALARSTDGGEGFQRFVADADVHRVASPDEATPDYSEMIPAIATDPARAGRVAVAWPEANGPDNSRIVLRYSSDGGAHWSGRVDVADDPATTSDQHDHVTLAWLGDGRLFAGWRDRRCCGGGFDRNYQEWVRVLRPGPNGALVPGRTVEFTDGPQKAPTGEGRGVLQPDEFQGLVATSAGVGLTWSQLNGKLDDLMFRRVPLAAFGEAPGPCADSRRFAFVLHGAPRQRIVRAIVYINGRRTRSARGHDLHRLTVPTLPVGDYEVRIVVVTSVGHRRVSVRRYHDCTKTPPRVTRGVGG